MPHDLQDVTRSVLQRARLQGYVVSKEIQAQLELAGKSAKHWQAVVKEAGRQLSLRSGRYYYVPPIKARMKADREQLGSVKKAARELIRQYKVELIERERRSYHRIHMIQQVKVITADGTTLNLISQDVSLAGVRMIGSCDLQGQKVRIVMPSVDQGGGQWSFVVQILWSSVVGDNLIENGGIFVETCEKPD